ncbi:MAG: beta-galactosidase [Lentisphaerae bacterium]|nr:beta-galactosidase [Lentisphaerota bacterium]
MKTVEIKDGKIFIDNDPVQLISGALHYFRVHPELWDDRLDKAVALGLNAVETYIPWNLHEPHPGEYCFSGIADLPAFINKVQAHGLKLILRPGPYICAEWDNGGFPGWLLAVPGIELRRMNKPYLEALTRYYDILLPMIRKKTYPNGGPVIMVQLENEYGSFGHDKDYLEYIGDLYAKHRIDVPQFTSDGAVGHYITGGTLPGVLMTLNFGSNPENAFRNGRMYRPDNPDFCMEFWNGWFDHWGEEHHIRQDDASLVLDEMLKMGAGVNLYMFHGGTNFGFTNGANGNFAEEYSPTVTSYDYDCPVSECGDATEKFYAFQKVIAKYTNNPNIKPVAPVKKVCPANVTLKESAPLLQNISVLSTIKGHTVTPPTMEQLGENFGFLHYSTMIDGPLYSKEKNGGYQEVIRLIDVNDFALVWLDGKFLGSRWRENGKNPIEIPEIPAEGSRLDVLVENCGRINYGPKVGRDFKGIVGGVALEMQLRFNWDYNMLPMRDLSGLTFGGFSDSPATFHRGTIELEEIGEAFLVRPGTKGLVWVNGFNLGRYWSKGPTETLYIPSPVLKKGINEIIVLELEKLDSATLKFSPELRLGALKGKERNLTEW